jgi:pyridoxamine 5'-phosphate oxidase-like protein
VPRSIATTTSVPLPELLEFVGPRHRFLLATSRRDGRPQLSPVAGGVDDSGRLVVSSYPSRAKVTNAAQDGLVDYFRSISGEHPDWDEYRAAMRVQDKSLLRITPTRWGPIATGGFPADVAARLDG